MPPLPPVPPQRRNKSKIENDFIKNLLKARLNTQQNHMCTTEAAPWGSRKCEREDVEPHLKDVK